MSLPEQGEYDCKKNCRYLCIFVYFDVDTGAHSGVQRFFS